MASSSTSSIQKSFKYHVFLSFRGEDTRKSFVDHLYHSLQRRGIDAFRDNEKLEKGKQIGQLFEAIEESRYFIIVFSKNYASSSWCLREVTKIMECHDEVEQIAYPVFYDVEPSDIRKRSGPVGRAIAKHKTNKQIKKWEKALESAGNLVGWNLKNIANGHEAEAIEKICEIISLKLRSIHLSNDENLIGMKRRMQDLESSLGIGLNDKVRMIGIKGMGGIGKTTLARAIFNRISSQFQGTSFLENVREVSKARGGLLSLQQQLLSDVLKDGSMHNVSDGKSMMKLSLPYKKVLIVLDDVDNINQLEALAGRWFKDGSRIIITTRHDKLLLDHGVNENWIHDVSVLSGEEALSLFSWYAFKRYKPIEGYEKLSLDVVDYAAGLPLTIRVLGSNLRGEKDSVWIDALKRLAKIPCKETLEVLETSYLGLEHDQQQIFLDVACFMKGLRKEIAIRILKSCGYFAVAGLRVLEQKSLVTISNQRLGMHDRIEDLGRDIVRREHRDEPKKHSRLWDREEIEYLLSREVDSEARCVRLEPVELSPEIVVKGLGNLKKLRVLLLSGRHDDCFRNDWKFDQFKEYFPNELQFLSWESYPLWSLPQTFRADNLVGLELPSSRIKKLWESGDSKVLKKLRFLDLSESKLRTLNLGMTPNLERLDLKGCRKLTKLHVPAGCLEKLVYLNLIGCSRFKSFPFIKQLERLGLLNLPNLEVIVESLDEYLRYSRDNLPKLGFTCHYLQETQPASSEGNGLKSVSLTLQPRTKLESFSGSICCLQRLKHLTFNGCIPEVPNDLDQLKCLQKLSLLSTHIKCLPDSICMLKHLNSLQLQSCELLEELPENLGELECLEELSLLSTGIRRLPDSICTLKRLKSLEIKSCERLEEVPEGLGQLECLEKLNLSARVKRLPESICMLKHLKSLKLESCRLLEKLPKDLGELEYLEELILTQCASLGDIPNSICKMKRLRCFHLLFCRRVAKLPEELGNLDCLKELNIKFTGISRLPQSISSLKGLRIVGSEAVLQSCAFATEVQTSESETFCYIQEVDDTDVETQFLFRGDYCSRWCWPVVLVVVLLVMQAAIQERV